LTKDTTIVPQTPPASYLTSYATSDFTGGQAAELNADLLNRLQQGIAAKCLANSATSAALLRSVPAFASFLTISILGMGAPEQLRDKHSIIPVATGGRVDWYVRTQDQLQRLLLTKTATLVAQAGDGFGIWQFALGRNDAPGFYSINNIRPAGTDPATVISGFAVTSDVRGTDLTGTGFIPDVATAVEGAYSRYQTTVIQFKDTLTPTTTVPLGTTGSYDLEARGMPLIGDIQDHVLTPAVRHRAMDCLVKAPIPCTVQLSLTVFRANGAPVPDTAGMVAALCAAVNAVGFTGQLYASDLQDVAHAYTGGSSTSAIDMLGRIQYPDLTVSWVRSREVLTIPNDAALMTSPRTVQFFAAPEDVAIGVVTVVPSDV
jgi:hypothetical protein